MLRKEKFLAESEPVKPVVTSGEFGSSAAQTDRLSLETEAAN